MIRATWEPLAAAAGQARLLVLGVTRELLMLDWPSAPRLVTVDSSAGTIASSWRPHPSLPSDVMCERWQDMSLADGSIDAAVGDGSLNALTAFEDYPVVLDRIARVLRPGGVLAVRCFVQPEPRETPEQVVELAMKGAFAEASGFRFRMTMAMAATGDGSMVLGDLPGLFSALIPDRDLLAAATGWSRSEIDLIDTGAGLPVRITFPGEAELVRLVEPRFERIGAWRGHYTQSPFCPTMAFRRR